MNVRHLLDKSISEKEFQDLVIDTSHLKGWGPYHTHDSRHSPGGFPDLVLIRPPRLIYAELKVERGVVSPAQQWWLNKLMECKQETYLWRPSDWASIEEALR